VAGFTAARAVRKLDPDIRIEVYSREPYLYYYRPRLPDLVAGEVEPDDIIAYQPDWYESHAIEVRLRETVLSVDTDGRSIVLNGGRRASYDALLLASGADPFVPPIPGADIDGVFVLRTMDHALSIRERAAGARSAVVIGGGLLGLETGRGLQRRGLSVTVLETADWLMPRQLDRDGAAVLLEDVGRLGIDVMTGVTVERVEGENQVTGVRLADGTVLPCDMTLISTGVRSTVGYLEGSGLAVDRGVVVGRAMESSIENVFAAGDVAQAEGMQGGNIPVAIAQAEAAAVGLSGDPDGGRAEAVSYNTLKIVGVDVFSAGATSCDDESCSEHVHRNAEAGIYRKVVVRGGVITGAMVVGSRAGVTQLNDLIQKGADVGKWGDAIASEDFDFEKID